MRNQLLAATTLLAVLPAVVISTPLPTNAAEQTSQNNPPPSDGSEGRECGRKKQPIIS